MKYPFHFKALIFPIVPSSLNFSDEINAQRRRKGSGPDGRAEAPVYRRDTGGSGGGPPPSSGGGGGGLRLPLWLIIVLVVAFLIFGGKGLIGQLLGGGVATTLPQ